MKWLLCLVATTLVCVLATGCSVSPALGRNVNRVAERAAEGTSAASDAMPSYEPLRNLTGKMTSIGGPMATYLVARLAAEFGKMYPDVTLQITSCPASGGPAALLDGRAEIVPMSRELDSEEIRAFTTKYGYAPTQIKVAADALAICVAEGNPLRGLTLGQVDAIFSRTQRRGGTCIETWSQAGLSGEWADRPVILFGYAPDTGATRTFRQLALNRGELRLSLRVQGGGSAIVQGVAATPGGIGFVSIYFACKAIRWVPLAGADGRFYSPTTDNVRSRHYPLSRFLYVCVNKPPHRAFDGPAAEFLRFLLSKEGQDVVAAGGNISLDAATVNEGRRDLAR